MKKTEMDTAAWQRLEQVIKWSGMSTNKFARIIGLNRSESLYQIKRGSFGISKELSSLISKRYPQISRSWLITGDGEMMLGVNAAVIDGGVTTIPFYAIDVAHIANINLEEIKPLYSISFPVAADFAVQCIGHSMAPEIPNGATVLLKSIDISTLIPGVPYLVVMSDYSTIKIVRTVPGDSTKLLLQPRNTVDFDEMIIEKSKIIKLYVVKTVIVPIG